MEKGTVVMSFNIRLDGNSDFDFETTKVLVAEATRQTILLEQQELEPTPTAQELDQEYWPFIKRS